LGRLPLRPSDHAMLQPIAAPHDCAAIPNANIPIPSLEAASITLAAIARPRPHAWVTIGGAARRQFQMWRCRRPSGNRGLPHRRGHRPSTEKGPTEVKQLIRTTAKRRRLSKTDIYITRLWGRYAVSTEGVGGLDRFIPVSDYRLATALVRVLRDWIGRRPELMPPAETASAPTEGAPSGLAGQDHEQSWVTMDAHAQQAGTSGLHQNR
jgi:hypothetical protein